MELDKIQKQIRDFLEAQEGVVFCYVFGSAAQGRTGKDSDIDIAVYFDTNKEKDFFEKRLELIKDFSQLLKTEADVLVLNTASPFMKFVVLQEGKLVFERDEGKRIDFDLKATNEYFDYKPILNMYRERLLAS